MPNPSRMIPLNAWLAAKGLSRGFHYDHKDDPDYVRTERQGCRIFVSQSEDDRYTQRLRTKGRRGRPRKTEPADAR